jgi:hypothetical protein
MESQLETSGRESKRTHKLVPLAPFMAVIAVTAAVIFGMGATLSWQVCLVVAMAAAALAVGIVFTVLEIRHLGEATAKHVR